jgi:hypothetical protein
VSTVQEIEAAIGHLPANERDAFESRLLARRCGLDVIPGEEWNQVLASLDEAEADIDAGRTLSAGELRKKLATWVGP